MRIILFMSILFTIMDTPKAEDASHMLLIERIRPLGAVHVDKPKAEGGSANPVTVRARSGEAIYHQHCSLCHETGVAGAPKFRQANEWAPRITKAGGVKGLLVIATKGLNAMPPMGTCQACTQEELMQAIDYMVPKGSK